MKKIKTKKPTESNCEATVDLVFDGKNVHGVWYTPELGPVLCALCGKNCKDNERKLCYNINPLCG